VVEIPKSARGDEIIRYKEVPKKFWKHLLATRRVQQKLIERFDGAKSVGMGYSDDTIQGRSQRVVTVEFPDEETRSSIQVPSEVEGIEIETGIAPDVEPRNCEHTYGDAFYQGGQFGAMLDDHPDLGGCYDTGHGTRAGTLGCLIQLEGDNTRYILTSRHQFNPNEVCTDHLDRPAHAGFVDIDGDGSYRLYPTGHTSAYQSGTLDYVLIGNKNKSCWQGDYSVLPMSTKGRLYRQTDQIKIKGYTLNLDEEPQGATFYNPSHKTGFNKAFFQGTGLLEHTDCAYIDGAAKFDHDNANGDSGSVYYKEIYDPTESKYVAEIAAVLAAGGGTKAGTVQCIYDDGAVPITDTSIGVPAEQIQNDIPKTFYFGGNW